MTNEPDGKSLNFLQVILRKFRTVKIRFDEWKRNPSRLILKSIRGVESPVFVQIGSNDGKSNDPFYPLLCMNPSWSALLVEPIPAIFDRLKINYGGRPNTKFVNAAIVDGPPGELVFYYLSDDAKKKLPQLPSYYDQLGSFDRDHIFKHLGHEVEPFVVSAIFPSLSLSDLLVNNRIVKLDVLHIDTEGYDWKILKQLDFQKYSPLAILFEHVHLSKEELVEVKRKLESDYRLYDLGNDYFCRRK